MTKPVFLLFSLFSLAKASSIDETLQKEHVINSKGDVSVENSMAADTNEILSLLEKSHGKVIKHHNGHTASNGRRHYPNRGPAARYHDNGHHHSHALHNTDSTSRRNRATDAVVLKAIDEGHRDSNHLYEGGEHQQYYHSSHRHRSHNNAGRKRNHHGTASSDHSRPTEVFITSRTGVKKHKHHNHYLQHPHPHHNGRTGRLASAGTASGSIRSQEDSVSAVNTDREGETHSGTEQLKSSFQNSVFHVDSSEDHSADDAALDAIFKTNSDPNSTGNTPENWNDSSSDDTQMLENQTPNHSSSTAYGTETVADSNDDEKIVPDSLAVQKENGSLEETTFGGEKADDSVGSLPANFVKEQMKHRSGPNEEELIDPQEYLQSEKTGSSKKFVNNWFNEPGADYDPIARDERLLPNINLDPSRTLKHGYRGVKNGLYKMDHESRHVGHEIHEVAGGLIHGSASALKAVFMWEAWPWNWDWGLRYYLNPHNLNPNLPDFKVENLNPIEYGRLSGFDIWMYNWKSFWFGWSLEDQFAGSESGSSQCFALVMQGFSCQAPEVDLGIAKGPDQCAYRARRYQEMTKMGNATHADTFMWGKPEHPGANAGKCIMKLARNGCWGSLEESSSFDTFMLVPCRRDLIAERVCMEKVYNGAYCGSANTYLGKAPNSAHCALAISKENTLFTFGKYGTDAGACYVQHTATDVCESGYCTFLSYRLKNFYFEKTS